MEKKILLAVDNSIHSKNAVKYAARISSLVKNVSYTLFNVQPTISQYILEDAKKDARVSAELSIINRKNAEEAQRILEKYKTIMINLGIKEQHIDTITQPKKEGTAKDILRYARQGMYDTIVVGRRGQSLIKQVFMDCTTCNLLEHASDVPVWVVDGDVKPSKILLAADGSESSIRAVDHLRFMVGDNPDVRITLFHVVPDSISWGTYTVDGFLEEFLVEKDRQKINDFHDRVHRMFKEASIPEDRIEIKKVQRSDNAGKAILEEAQTGDYSTVVVGRRGNNQSFFMGSVSRYMLNRTEDRTLWVVS
jgi:nucleotide-binding universal stress UspA family protein